MYSKAELLQIAEVVAQYPQLLVISDEVQHTNYSPDSLSCCTGQVYEHVLFDGVPHERFAALPGMWERTVTLFSLGKSFSCTGWRVGGAIGPEQLIGATTTHSTTSAALFDDPRKPSEGR